MSTSSTPDRRRFHLALLVDDLGAARRISGEVLGCAVDQSDDHWVDLDLIGNQIVAHRVTDAVG